MPHRIAISIAQLFEAPNYGTCTTSELEYSFVTEPMCDHQSKFEVYPGGAKTVQEWDVQREGTLRWPAEKKLEDAAADSREAGGWPLMASDWASGGASGGCW